MPSEPSVAGWFAVRREDACPRLSTRPQRFGGEHVKAACRAADARHVRGIVIGLVVATVAACAACSGEHDQRPRVSQAAAEQLIEQRAREWSMRGKIVDLSCRSGPDSATVTCAGSRVE
jgi:hypothetical protein